MRIDTICAHFLGNIVLNYLLCCFLEQDKETDNAVVGPMPLMQDAANQDIRE